MIHQPRARSRCGSIPLLLAISFIVAYLLYNQNTEPSTSIPSRNHQRHETSQTPISHVRNYQILLTTDTKDWSKSRSSSPGVGIYQPPLSGPQPAGKRIAIATMNTDETTYDHISLRNKFGYAAKHNYGIKFDLTPPSGLVPLAVWHKLNMIEYLVRTQEYDWIWWIDYDTIITNTTVKLEDIVASSLSKAEKPDEIDLILTADCWPLNAGSMLLRSTPRLLSFLSAVWECGNTPDELSEQDCILRVLTTAPTNLTYRHRALWVPQATMNAFPTEIGCLDKHKQSWKPGDFVVHFAGAWSQLKGELKKDAYGVLMRKYNEWVDKTKLRSNDFQVLGSIPDVQETSVEVIKNPKFVDSDDEEGTGKKKKKKDARKKGKSS